MPFEGFFALFVGVGAEPFPFAEFRLVGEEAERVGKSLEDFSVGVAAFGFVRVALVDELAGNAVGRKKEGRCSYREILLGEEIGDASLEGTDVGWVGGVRFDPAEFGESFFA